MEILGEVEVFDPAGEGESLPVDFFVLVAGHDPGPFVFLECPEMMGDVTLVEFHPGEVVHLV